MCPSHFSITTRVLHLLSKNLQELAFLKTFRLGENDIRVRYHRVIYVQLPHVFLNTISFLNIHKIFRAFFAMCDHEPPLPMFETLISRKATEVPEISVPCEKN